MKLNMKGKLLLLSTIICLIGIIVSPFIIDREIDKYIEQISTEVVINIDVVNNTNDEVSVIEDDGTIIVTVDEEVTLEEQTDLNINVRVISEVGLNIRENPTVDSEIVGTYSYGESVNVIEDEGEWYKTDRGYIYKEFVN